jgi:hypothetical protein
VKTPNTPDILQLDAAKAASLRVHVRPRTLRALLAAASPALRRRRGRAKNLATLGYWCTDGCLLFSTSVCRP